MIRKITLSLMACMVVCTLSMAQKCGFDVIHQRKMQTDPAYAQSFNQFDQNLANWIKNRPVGLIVPTTNGNKAWEIPVVVHIIDTANTTPGSKYNPTDAAIQAMVNYLSQAFQAQYAGHLTEANGGTRIPIVFKLAQRSPNCATTNGIVRVNAGSDATYAADGVTDDPATNPGIADAALKAKSYWPNTEYYNIWIVNKIDGRNSTTGGGPYTAGYAYPSGFNGPNPVDGTVMLADQVGVGNSVITHELGHAFNLMHVFQGANMSATPPTCPPATTGNCNLDGDRVCDTEPMLQSMFNCPTGINTCTGVPYNNGQRNFMDYSNCKDRFTSGQRTRVVASLMTYSPSTGGTIRSSLVSSLGATPLSATPMVAASCSTTNTALTTNTGPRDVWIVKTGGPIDSVVMSAISGSYAEDGNKRYFDRTCQHRAELVAGTQYKINVRVGNSAEYVRAYIDYDNNGTFSSTEEIFAPNNPYTGEAPFTTYTFTVPATATKCTPIRMRVVTSNTVPGPCTAGITGQMEDYSVVIRGVTGSGVTGTGVVTIQDPPIEGNPSCLGTNITLAAKRPSTAGITPVWYGWYRKSLGETPPISTYTLWSSSTTDSTWNANVFKNLDSVFVKVGYPGLCGIDTTISDTITLFRPVTVAPAVTITGPTNGCPGATVTYTATPTSNPGGAPTYAWEVNGSTVPGASGATFSTVLSNNSTVRVVMTSSSSCASPLTATSPTITFTEQLQTPTVQMALTTGTNPGCTGQQLVFSVTTSTFSGTNPTYQWKVNGTPQPGANSTSFSTSTLSNGDIVSLDMTSNSSCAAIPTVSSNQITIIFSTITADVTIAQTSGNNPLCSGHRASYTATPINGGPVPQYQWMINSTPVIGANSQVFSTSSLLNNDIVQCILVSSDPCVVNTLDTSAGITVQVNPSAVPTVSFSMTKGNNPGCLDSLIEFTATATNIGTGPNFDWFVNGFGPVYNGTVFTSVDLLNGDVVTVRANQTDGGCYLPDTVFSAPDTMTLSPTPDPPIISLIGNNLITNKSGAYIWYGPGGQLTNSSTGTYHPTVLGQYWCVTDNNGCWSKPSNKLTITLLDINTYNIEQVDIFPNPTAGQLTLDWKHAVNMKIDVYSTVGQKLMQDEIRNESSKTINLSKLANGIYFVVITDEQGKSGTARVTVNK